MPTTIAKLRELTGSTRVDADLALFIEQGQLVVNTYLVPIGTLATGILDSISLYLAGHFYVLSVEGGGITYARAGQSEERYKSFGYETYGFMTTRFGQMACAFDTTGVLAKMSTKNVVVFEAESYTNRKAPPALKVSS